MALNSVNTNAGAMVALQSLNKTNDAMEATQKRISTGFRVADAKDDGAAYAVAERIRGDLAATTSANEQLGGIKQVLDPTMTGLTSISSAMQDVKAMVVKLAGSLGSDERAQIMTKMKTSFSSISFSLTDLANGRSMVNTTATAGDTGTTLGEIKTVRNGVGALFTFSKVATASINGATDFTALTGLGMTTSGAATGATLVSAMAKFASALTEGGAVNMAIRSTLTSLNTLGSYSNYVDDQITFNKAKMDAQEAGMGALIDADLAKESATLQSLQIRQQLGSQALGIANQAPQVLLSLFR
ncbi:MAG: flagellin [Rubritepida sp.]|nr:flagellin [Rubritepida sp.]